MLAGPAHAPEHLVVDAMASGGGTAGRLALSPLLGYVRKREEVYIYIYIDTDTDIEIDIDIDIYIGGRVRRCVILVYMCVCSLYIDNTPTHYLDVGIERDVDVNDNTNTNTLLRNLRLSGTVSSLKQSDSLSVNVLCLV